MHQPVLEFRDAVSKVPVTIQQYGAQAAPGGHNVGSHGGVPMDHSEQLVRWTDDTVRMFMNSFTSRQYRLPSLPANTTALSVCVACLACKDYSFGSSVCTSVSLQLVSAAWGILDNIVSAFERIPAEVASTVQGRRSREGYLACT
jgi:hypothetical protein